MSTAPRAEWLQQGGADGEDRIRRRAYQLWQQAGCTGDAEDHWFRAERELEDDWEPGERRTQRRRFSGGPGVRVAMACGAELRSFYDSLPVEPPPTLHWELAVEIAAGPEQEFRSLEDH